MSKVTVRSLIAVHLHELLLSTTQKQRPASTDAQQQRKISVESVREIRSIIDNIWGTSYSDRVMRMLSLATNNEELLQAPGSFDVFSVVVVGTDATGHGYKLNHPYIVVHKDKRQLMGTGGKLSTTTFNVSSDKVRLATDEEVESCIRALTDDQWKTIMTDPLFAPIIAKALDDEIEPVVKKSKKTKEKEVKVKAAA